nr:putative RNA-directed DNA polymerase, eukaryota, reverse transcriptase zinc-binding domain protein [Tanacetum cinerariifolium]
MLVSGKIGGSKELVTLVHDVRLVPMSDRWTWTLANSREFSVASVRQLIDDKTLPDVDSKTRWIKYVPIKVDVLAWKVKSDSLPTRFNVSRRGGGTFLMRSSSLTRIGWPGIHYKIIAKVLANSLSKVINNIVSPEQTAFIASRHILNGPLILSGVIDWTWIKACLKSSRTSILVNGNPTSKFNVRRGLRQGDPLSPFFFVIIMEGLHVAISDSVCTGLIRGIKFGSLDVNLSHLLSADDVIIMSDWSSHDVENIIRIFKVFFLASGLKINIHKSSIYGAGVPPEEIHHMASNTGCSAGLFPITYLGLPIGSNMSLTANWKLLVDKFHSKLSSWKASLLSYGGHLTLLKTVLGSLGCGSTIRFWKDTCLGSSLLQFRYNRLFRLDRNEDCLISDHISNGLWEWYWSRDALCSRNTMYINHLLTEISYIEVREGMDKCIWDVSQYGNFIVGSLRCLIDDHTLPSLVSKTTWEKFLPRKCHEPNSEGSGSTWKAYMNAWVTGLFLLVLLEYPNGKGVVRVTSRGLDMALHWSGVGAAPLMSPRQDKTSEPLLYAGWMTGPYRVEDTTPGQNDDPVPSGIRAKSDRGGPK